MMGLMRTWGQIFGPTRATYLLPAGLRFSEEAHSSYLYLSAWAVQSRAEPGFYSAFHLSFSLLQRKDLNFRLTQEDDTGELFNRRTWLKTAGYKLQFMPKVTSLFMSSFALPARWKDTGSLLPSPPLNVWRVLALSSGGKEERGRREKKVSGRVVIRNMPLLNLVAFSSALADQLTRNELKNLNFCPLRRQGSQSGKEE